MHEQRRYQRVPYFRPLRITVLPEGRTVPGRSFDISRGGVGLVADVSVGRGHSVVIHFQVEDERKGAIEVSVQGRVAYSRADEDGNYIGIEFPEEIHGSSQPVLAEMLDNL
jgi:c-di-GMP-binding flagellar brake protein YcgR